MRPWRGAKRCPLRQTMPGFRVVSDLLLTCLIDDCAGDLIRARIDLRAGPCHSTQTSDDVAPRPGGNVFMTGLVRFERVNEPIPFYDKRRIYFRWRTPARQRHLSVHRHYHLANRTLRRANGLEPPIPPYRRTRLTDEAPAEHAVVRAARAGSKDHRDGYETQTLQRAQLFMSITHSAD